jgi:hypothetical protein
MQQYRGLIQSKTLHFKQAIALVHSPKYFVYQHSQGRLGIQKCFINSSGGS